MAVERRSDFRNPLNEVQTYMGRDKATACPLAGRS
jgi:hypothetical protein